MHELGQICFDIKNCAVKKLNLLIIIIIAFFDNYENILI